MFILKFAAFTIQLHISTVYKHIYDEQRRSFLFTSPVIIRTLSRAGKNRPSGRTEPRLDQDRRRIGNIIGILGCSRRCTGSRSGVDTVASARSFVFTT